MFPLCIQQQLKYIVYWNNVENNADWLASNKTWKKWTGIRDGQLLSYAGIDYKKPTDEER